MKHHAATYSIVLIFALILPTMASLYAQFGLDRASLNFVLLMEAAEEEQSETEKEGNSELEKTALFLDLATLSHSLSDSRLSSIFELVSDYGVLRDVHSPPPKA